MLGGQRWATFIPSALLPCCVLGLPCAAGCTKPNADTNQPATQASSAQGAAPKPAKPENAAANGKADASRPPVAKKSFDFAAAREKVLQRIEDVNDRQSPEAAYVHDPPMVSADKINLDAGAHVIGVAIGDEARAYPLAMLFGRSGIFELLNDSVAGVPIAPSW